MRQFSGKEHTSFIEGASTPQPLAEDGHPDRQVRMSAPDCFVEGASYSRPTMEESVSTLPLTSAEGAVSLPPASPTVTQCSVMKLPSYNGEEPPETYLIQVQLVAQFNAWSAEETAVQVALALEGKALEVLTDLQPEEHFDWHTIEGVIQHRFSRQAHADDAQEKLAGCRRRDGGSLAWHKWLETKWKTTMVTSELARLQGERVLQVTAANHIVDHKLWLADIQDPCIIGLDLLDKWEAMVDIPRTARFPGHIAPHHQGRGTAIRHHATTACS